MILGFLEDLFDLIVTSVEYVFVFTALMLGFNITSNISIKPNREDPGIEIPQINPTNNEKFSQTSTEDLDLESLIPNDEDLFQEIYDILDLLLVKFKGSYIEAIGESSAYDDEIFSINETLTYLLDSMDESEIEIAFENILFFEFTEMALYVGIQMFLTDPMELYLKLINMRNSNFKRQLDGLPSIPEDSELLEHLHLEYSTIMGDTNHIPHILEFETEPINNQMINNVLKFSPELIYDEDSDEDFVEDFEHFLVSSSHGE